MAEKYQESVDINERALAIREVVYGHDHVDVAISLQHKAWSQMHLGSFEEANKNFQESLNIREKISKKQGLISNTYQVCTPLTNLPTCFQLIAIVTVFVGGLHKSL